MKVLLSDGSGLTSRQVATILGRKGDEVHVLCAPGLSLTKVTGWVKKTHLVPQFGPDPYKWLQSALQVMIREKIKTIICTQEQVAVLSAEVDQIRNLGVGIAVPSFEAVSRVIDKISASRTLQQASLLQPETVSVGTADELRGQIGLLPAFVKTPIGTASKGVRFAKTAEDLARVGQEFDDSGAFRNNGRLLVQKAVAGPLVMVEGVFSGGRLLSWHACLRAREGPSGGAAKKTSLPLPVFEDDMKKLGAFLKYDAALSIDAILVEGIPYYIDVNPRITEPMNAFEAGVDLVESLLSISTSARRAETIRPIPPSPVCGIENINTHQFVLAAMKAVESGRFALLLEIFTALLGLGEYANSTEELTPVRDDPLSAVFLCVFTSLVLLGGGRVAKYLDKSSVSNYALSPSGWEAILKAQQAKEIGEVGAEPRPLAVESTHLSSELPLW
ncbi:uncharacterized protein PV07_05551 [Cladophialophora immunda]|uniref:ATP-grasp domain-containing protein n=1 Tax=Cladophialophora immunda TaxID=569365 RepID=A0A0D2AWV2_9EURO|nr:uncharacterized protein PV07_05551 [Cladophialophora immunda]KIW29762.1 hypothetical protein PV07_05551 [Cladophialophora immunda]OQU94876.1 ATP-grasp domain-containing protein [Cladophialophora immunda]